MKKKLLIINLFFTLFFSGLALHAQEISEIRTTKYSFNLNAIKHQYQVDSVTIQTKKIDNVNNCELDWLNYKMELIVKEGGNLGSFPMEKLKAILIKNNISLINFTKETIH